jgi:peptide/nickel transport system permease protein
MIGRLLRHGSGRLGFALVVLLLLVALFAPWLAPHDPNRIDVANRFAGPSLAHPLGTDQLGRDLASRLAFGARIALGVALTAVALAAAAGTALGMAAAWTPRWVEQAIVALFDVLGSFPSLIFALALAALLGPGLSNVIVVVALTLAPQFGRVARAQCLSLRQAPFIEAERALGAGPLRIALRHVLPNIAGPIAVLACMDVPVVVTIEAALSFLGVGVAPPLASWGALLHDGYEYLSQARGPAVYSALALALATLGFTLFGEGMRDAIDPKLRIEP